MKVDALLNQTYYHPLSAVIITKYDNFIKERKTVIDYDKQLDLEILFMEMFEKCPDGDLAEILLEEIQNIAECSLEQIKEEKGWE